MADSDSFYEEVVSPSVRDFEAERHSLRYAYYAVWALDSFASHLFYDFKTALNLKSRDDSDFKRSYLAKKSEDFQLVLDASIAAKHALITRAQGKRTILASSDVASVKLEGWSSYYAGPDGDDRGEQIVVHNDKHFCRPLLPTTLRAESFLVGELANMLVRAKR